MEETLVSPEYGVRLLAGLSGLIKDGLLCDLTLVAEGQQFEVHRSVMAASSDYFRALLTLDMIERSQESIDLKGVPARGLKEIISFAYTGQLRCAADNISDILLAASHLQYTDAITLCSEFLTNLTQKSNSMDMYSLAEQFNLPSLQEKALMLILQNFEEIASQDDFVNFQCEFLGRILDDNRLRVSSELKLYELVLKWVTSSLDDRRKHLPQLMSKVRLPLILPVDLVEVVMQESLMRTNEECLDLLLEANKYHMLPDAQPLMQNERTQVRADTPSLMMLDIDEEGPRVFDLATEHWAILQSAHLDTFHAQVCVLENYMYVCGGIELYSSNNPVSGKSYRYDPRFDTWTDIASMQEARHHFTLIADTSAIYAIGGYCTGSFKGVVESYSVEGDRWGLRTSMDVRVSAAAAALHNGKIYVSGGQTDKGITKCLWCYNIQLDRWYGKNSMNQARMDHAMSTYGDKLYVLGGYDKNIIKAYDVDTVETYDFETDQWTIVKEGSPKISAIYSCIIATKIYTVGGFSYDENKKRNEVWCYDIATNEWSVTAKILTSAMSVPCCALYLPREILRNVTV